MILVKHETKTIRPFLHADDLRHVFSNTAFRLKASDDFVADEVLTIHDEDRALLDPSIILHIELDAVKSVLGAMAISEADVQVWVIATSHEMRRSETVASFPLDGLPEDEFLLKSKISAFQAAKGGYEITVAMLLSGDIEPQPLRPTAFGQWLAKKTFTIRPEQPSNSFRTLPLNEEDRNRLGLPEGTMHYVEMNGGSLNDRDARLENCVTVWVAESIFNSLSRDDASKSSVAIQKMLVSSVTLSFVIEQVRELENGDSLESGSPLDGFFTDLAKDSGVAKDKLVEYARPQGDKAKLGAYIQKMLQINSAIKAAV